MKRLLITFIALISAFYVGSLLNRHAFTQTPPEEQAPQPPPPDDEETPAAAAPPTAGVSKNDFQSFLEPFIYDTKGRRDPFRPYVEMRAPEEGEMQGPLLPLQRYDLDDIKLTGIIWDVRSPKALFVDPGKQTHILGRDDRIGRNNGYIAVIREGEVVVVEAQRIRGETVYSTRIMKLPR